MFASKFTRNGVQKNKKLHVNSFQMDKKMMEGKDKPDG